METEAPRAEKAMDLSQLASNLTRFRDASTGLVLANEVILKFQEFDGVMSGPRVYLTILNILILLAQTQQPMIRRVGRSMRKRKRITKSKRLSTAWIWKFGNNARRTLGLSNGARIRTRNICTHLQRGN